MVTIVVLEYPWVMIADAVTALAAAEEALEAVVETVEEATEALAVVLVLAAVLDDVTAGTLETMVIRGV